MNYNRILLVIIVIMYIQPPGEIFSQDGAWVEYSLDGFGSGAYMYDCGAECCTYTRANSQYVLVFDIQKGEWLKADMGEVQTFNDVINEGSVILAWSDDLLFGYSSVTSDWDTIRYEGSLLRDNYQQLYRSYGCSDSIAFFISDSKFYAFDSRTGNWLEYEYGLPQDYTAGYFFPKDDCIYFSLHTSDPYGIKKNVAYSSHTGSFRMIENGTYLGSSDYDHGFCRIRDLTGYGDELWLVGYSAYDNEFDLITYFTETNESVIGYSDAAGIEADEFIANSVAFRTIVTPSELVRVKFYGYSTVLGEWNTVTYDIDWESERYYGNGHAGGKFTMDHSLEQGSQKWRFFFYSAVNGQFSKLNTDLVYTSTTSGYTLGGSVFSVFDATNAWGYNPVTGNGKLIAIDRDHSTHFYAGEDYITLARWSSDSDIMPFYFYNGVTNDWKSINISKNVNASEYVTPHVFVLAEREENEAIVYSSYKDSVMRFQFDEGVSFIPSINGNMVYIRSAGKSLLINAEDCSIHEKDFEFNQSGLGTQSAAFYDDPSKTLYGYSSVSNKWTTKTIQEDPGNTFDSEFIGLISAMYNGDIYGKFYAFNSLADSWIELDPEGVKVASIVGGKTALVIRQTNVYAFDPYGISGVNAIDDNPANDIFSLEQNYPNPFYDFTTITYRINNSSRVILKIYNSMGQEIRTLVSEVQAPGEYTIEWDGKNGSHQPVNPGIYFCKLKAGSLEKSLKMIRAND